MQLSSFVALQDWVSRTDINQFEILLCIGNKVDRIPGHPVHVEYRRRLQNLGESCDDPHPEFDEFGVSETEGSSLLGNEEPSSEIKRSCLEWCSEHNIEYIEACASNADFDKCKTNLLPSVSNCLNLIIRKKKKLLTQVCFMQIVMSCLNILYNLSSTKPTIAFNAIFI